MRPTLALAGMAAGKPVIVFESEEERRLAGAESPDVANRAASNSLVAQDLLDRRSESSSPSTLAMNSIP
jgi:hypothetical protein